jgi:hypothetical protein
MILSQGRVQAALAQPGEQVGDPLAPSARPRGTLELVP